jgi:hypothetical protein
MCGYGDCILGVRGVRRKSARNRLFINCLEHKVKRQRVAECLLRDTQELAVQGPNTWDGGVAQPRRSDKPWVRNRSRAWRQRNAIQCSSDIVFFTGGRG